MRIEVAELDIGQVVQVAFAERINSLSDEVTFDAPVTGDVEVSRTRRTVHLRGRLGTSVPLSCGRCLTPFRLGLAADLDEEFLVDLQPAAMAEAGQQQLARKDFVFALGTDLVLDVSEVTRQHLLLAMPMVPLCRPECRGLCPQCGANWNETGCAHEVAATDPRLEPLLKIKDQLPEE